MNDTDKSSSEKNSSGDVISNIIGIAVFFVLGAFILGYFKYALIIIGLLIAGIYVFWIITHPSPETPVSLDNTPSSKSLAERRAELERRKQERAEYAQLIKEANMTQWSRQLAAEYDKLIQDAYRVKVAAWEDRIHALEMKYAALLQLCDKAMPDSKDISNHLPNSEDPMPKPCSSDVSDIESF